MNYKEPERNLLILKVDMATSSIEMQGPEKVVRRRIVPYIAAIFSKLGGIFYYLLEIIFGKMEKISKSGQDQKTLISVLA